VSHDHTAGKFAFNSLFFWTEGANKLAVSSNNPHRGTIGKMDPFHASVTLCPFQNHKGANPTQLGWKGVATHTARSHFSNYTFYMFSLNLIKLHEMSI